MMVVSIIVKGAGSVEVFARPALPKTRSTSGTVIRILSWTCSACWASATDMPGLDRPTACRASCLRAAAA
jgi:hypothetical protein